LQEIIMIVSVARDGDIAIVTIDNPPVNATSHAVRAGLLRTLRETEGDARIAAVVLICAGRTFIAGADIREFGKPPQDPNLPDLLLALEGATKPWIAAIHGTALGGGLEFALVCRHRIATADAKLGLPEVTLGLIPGAGGTVRLPRLVEATTALDMIASGKPVTADRALAIGLIDRIAGGDLRTAALAMAREAAQLPLHPATTDRAVIMPTDPAAFDALAHRITAKAGPQLAPKAAVQALRTAMKEPAKTALAAERGLFTTLRDGPQSRALRHIFFAERATTRLDRLTGVTPLALNRIGIVGGGTMGAGIAAACLLAGHNVTMIERDATAVTAGRDRIHAILAGSLQRGLITARRHANILAAFDACDSYGALSDADLVIEAVFEDMAVKQQVFASLDAVTRPDAVLCSNTSYLNLDEIAATTRHPARVIGLHFFSPAHIMKLLEVVVPDTVNDTTLATGLHLAKSLGKIAVLAGVCDGFIANRIMSAYRREAEYMLEDGATPWQIDTAMVAFGMPMGVFQMQDLAGLDISWAMRKRQAATRDPAQRYVGIGDWLCERGRFGRKTGRGYYLYDANGMGRPDPEVESLVQAESARKGITRVALQDDAIMARLLGVMQAEGAAILSEGIARNADDIDVVMVNAYGFPRWTGGPMFLRSDIG